VHSACSGASSGAFSTHLPESPLNLSPAQSVNRVNAPSDGRGTLYVMGTLATLGLMALTVGATYALWSLLRRAERLFTRLEGQGQTAADVAGVAFLALAALIVFGASAALLLETRELLVFF